jgi:hypothetical protein
MDKRKIQELISEHTGRFLARKGLVRRDVQDEVLKFIPQREIVLITGCDGAGNPHSCA